MTLKEQTKNKHAEAEEQPFIKSIFAGNVNLKDYRDYLFQLAHVYNILEEVAGGKFNIFEDMLELKRSSVIAEDFNELAEKDQAFFVRESTMEYMSYLLKLDNKDDVMAHIYVRHMGDLFGGQSLAKLLPGSCKMYKFNNIKELVGKIRSKLNDSMGPEAIIAFDHNINIIKEYN